MRPKEGLMEHDNPRLTQPTPHEREVDTTRLRELVGYLRENRDALSEEWPVASQTRASFT